jgi:epoxyqueuosine reductase
MATRNHQYTTMIRAAALRHGFLGAGIARAEFMGEEAARLEAWLRQGYQGQMNYMTNYFELRTDPTRLVPGAKSVISLMYNYFPKEGVNTSAEGQALKISRYAFGEDYHKVIRRKLKSLVRELQQEIGDFTARVFVDSGPVLERDWAKRSGMAWIGRNTLAIHPRMGSYFFLAEIILDVELEYDHPIRDHCGTCTRCIEACPTDAISPTGYVLDGSKCISYLTIELKDQIPNEYKDKMEGWIFGCDICQEVCPWNRFSTPHTEPAFDKSEALKRMSDADWAELTEDVFQEVFEKSAVKRTGYSGLKRNIDYLSSPKQE